MQKKATKKEPKYVTMPVFEKSMASIARSFEKIESRLDQHDKSFILILNQLRSMQEEAREYRLSMSSLNHSDVVQEREIEGLKVRVEKLEQKVK